MRVVDNRRVDAVHGSKAFVEAPQRIRRLLETASLQGGQDEETEKQLMELVGARATPCDMLGLADESVPLTEAFATPINAGAVS